MADFGKQTVNRKKPNYLSTILSVALVLFMLGLCGILISQSNRLVNAYKEQIKILVELENDSSEDARKRLQADLGNSEFIKSESIEFISKDKGLDILEKELGEVIIQTETFQNPLKDIISFNLNAENMNSDDLADIKSGLRENPIVMDVVYQEGMVDKIGTNFNKIGLFTLLIGLVFFLVAIALIHNTIKLAMYSNRFLIKNMELVGASWDFISRPYIVKSIKNGIISAIIAIIVLLLLLFLIQGDFPGIATVFEDYISLGIIFLGLIVLGIFISGASTWLVVNKFLKMRLDDLY